MERKPLIKCKYDGDCFARRDGNCKLLYDYAERKGKCKFQKRDRLVTKGVRYGI